MYSDNIWNTKPFLEHIGSQAAQRRLRIDEVDLCALPQCWEERKKQQRDRLEKVTAKYRHINDVDPFILAGWCVGRNDRDSEVFL
jgi:pantothenate kinase-related protein Tda10